MLKPVLVATVFAQGILGQDFGDIPAEDLLTRSYPDHAGEPAIILLDQAFIGGNSYFLRRIKILSEAGKEYAEVRIPYLDGFGLEELKAHTVLPDGRRIKVEEFFDEGVDAFRTKVFTFPAVQPGCVLEYYYGVRKASPPVWYFQNRLWTRRSHVEVHMWPGARPPKTSFVSFHRPALPERQERPKLGDYWWTVDDIPAIPDEPFVRDLDAHRSGIVLGFSPDWLDWKLAGQWFWDWRDDFMDDGGATTEWLKPQLEGVTEPLAKAEVIYRTIRDELGDPQGRKIPKKVRDVVKQGVATNTQKNLMLARGFRDAGLSAEIVLICTRDHGQFQPGWYKLSQLNQDLVRTVIDGRTYYLETGDRHRPFGMLPPNLQVETGLLLADDDSRVIDLEIPEPRSATAVRSNVSLAANGDLSGKTAVAFHGYRKLETLREIDEQGEEDYVEDLLKELFERAELSGRTLQSSRDPAEPLTIVMEWSAPGRAQLSGDLAILPAPLFTAQRTNPLTRERRELPVEFPYAYHESEEVSVVLPVGWKLAERPAGAQIDTDFAYYQVTHWTAFDGFHVRRRFGMKAENVPAKGYDELKAVFGAAVAGDAETVVFKTR